VTPTPAAPAGGTPTPAAPAGEPTPPAPTITPEQAEALRQDAARWNAVKGLYREAPDGTLELNRDMLPPDVSGGRRAPDPETDPDAAAAARVEADRRAGISAEVADRTSRAATLITQDLSLQRTLEAELQAEPGGALVMQHARSLMEKVPVERRTEAAWRNAILFGKGATESKRRPMWEGEVRKRTEDELVKTHGLAIRKNTPKKTDDELVGELSDAQKEAADKMGVTHAAYARNLNKLQGGNR
jgi:hypothetical protein